MTRTFSPSLTISTVCFLFSFLFIGVLSAFAQTPPYAILTVNGGSSAAVVDGQPVLLEWQMEGVVNCSINNGVGSINTSGGAFTTGSTSVVPPSGATTQYVLICDGVTDTVEVSIYPEVTLAITSANPTTLQFYTVSVLDPVTHESVPETRYDTPRINYTWNAINANRCDIPWIETASNPGDRIYVNSQAWLFNSVSGTGSLMPNQSFGIQETFTLYQTCYNDAAGIEGTGSTTVVVNNPVPPSTPTLTIQNAYYPTDTSFVFNLSTTTGFADVNLRYVTTNAHVCKTEYYYADNSPYNSKQPYEDQPLNGRLAGHYYGIGGNHFFAPESIIIEVTCKRLEYTASDGIFYPEESITKTQLITVNGSYADTGPVDAFVGVSPLIPNVSELHPTKQVALQGVRFGSTNADNCELFITRDGYNRPWSWGGGGVLASGPQTQVLIHPGPTSNISTGVDIFTTEFTGSATNVYVTRCTRAYDLYMGNIDYGTEYATTSLAVDLSPTTNAPITVETYLDPLFLSAHDIESLRVGSAGLQYQTESVHAVMSDSYYGGFYTSLGSFVNGGNSSAWQTGGLVATDLSASPSITFTFPGNTGTYDIVMSLCTPYAGPNQVSVATASNGTVGSTAVHTPSNGQCNGGIQKRADDINHGAAEGSIIAQNVALTNGEQITVTCDALPGYEAEDRCAVRWIGFGESTPTVIDVTPDAVTGLLPIEIMWGSTNAMLCRNWRVDDLDGNRLGDFLSNTLSASAVNNGALVGMNDWVLSESSTFSLECLRNDGTFTSVSEEVTFLYPGDTLNVDVAALVAAGQCINPDPSLVPSPPNPGDVITAPPGYIAGEPDGVCVPAVDIIPELLSVNESSYNNVTGIYSTVATQLRIENISDQVIAAGEVITYASELRLENQSQPTTTSAIGDFVDGLAAAGPGNSDRSNPLDTTISNVSFGNYTLCARVNLDGSPNMPEGVTSNNTSCQTLSLPVQKPPMSISVSDPIISAGQTEDVTWSVNASYLNNTDCVVTGPSGFNETGLTGTNVTSAALALSGTFTLTCTEPQTSTVFTETATYAILGAGQCIVPDPVPSPFVSTDINGNAVVPGSVVATPYGYIQEPGTGLCLAAVDLQMAEPALSTAGATTNNVAGTYSSLPVLTVIENVGAGVVGPGDNINYRGTLTFQPAIATLFGLGATADTGTQYYNGVITAADIDFNTNTLTTRGESFTLQPELDDIPFGTHEICARVNRDPVDYVENYETDPTLNEDCSPATLPVPPPPMDITASDELIRHSQTTDIDWSINVTYPMDCRVVGPGGLDQSFTSGSGLITGSHTTDPLTSTSEYTFTCTETITNTTFTRTARVELVPEVEEI